MPLTDTVVRNSKPTAKARRLFDGGGLYLEVAPSGGKWWRLKYRFGGTGGDLLQHLRGNQPRMDYPPPIEKAINAPEVLRVLRRIEARNHLETAHRVMQHIGQVVRYAIATGPSRCARCPKSLPAILSVPGHYSFL